MTHICVAELDLDCFNDGFTPGRCKAIAVYVGMLGKGILCQEISNTHITCTTN